MPRVAVLPTSCGNPAPRLEQLRALQREGRHVEVVAGARLALADRADDRDLVLIAASSLRRLGQVDAALEMLDQLAAAHPHFSLLHEELGLCAVARKDAPGAIAALGRAVALNPALPMSWRMLEGVQRLVGDDAQAANAAAQSAVLRSLPGEVVAATALFADGELDVAERIIRAFLLRNGNEPEAMRLLAKIGIAHEIYDDAEALLAGVLAMVPDHRAARLEYAQTLALRQRFAEAGIALAPLLAAAPATQDYQRLAATIAVGLGRQEEAIALYRAMMADLPEDDPGTAAARADLHLWLGHALKTIGETAGGTDHYRLATLIRPEFGDAWWSLANLKTYRFGDDEIGAMRRAEAAVDTSPVDRLHLNFALGKAFEDRGEVADAWAHYARGNAAKSAAVSYRPDVIETNAREQARVCTAAFFAARQGWGAPAADPIFVVGLPRAGSTLIEQILASHSAIEGTQELPDIHRIAQELHGRDPDYDHPRYPAALAALSEADCYALGERYLAAAAAHRRSKRPFFVDKMPNNFRHIGLIRLILPNATIIDARREPMACCFSNLKQLFAQGQEFTYAAEDIARYYRSYLDLMRHWDAALPRKDGKPGVLRVIHEDVIDNLEANVVRLLDHCGLPFEPACLDFHKTRRSVRTPSSEQVRRPIFRDGLDQWRAFRPYLTDLEAALGNAVDDWRT